jgi:cyclopropane fatty-acyl-phospholipid synthase-like methyltransferase
MGVSVEELEGVFREAGVERSVTAVNADVRQLPSADGEFDAIVSIDAFEYFGTDVHLLPALLRVLKSGGTIGMTTPGLEPDPYEADVPGTRSGRCGRTRSRPGTRRSGGADTGS